MPCKTLLSGMLTFALLCPLAALAQTAAAYPSKPIRFITPFAPGGSTTTIARVIGQKLTESWGQNVIVDNRPGGNTIIGTEALAKSTPDGYTLLLTSNAHVTMPSLFPKLPYDSIKDFAPVGNVYSSEFVLVVSPALPVNNLQELIAMAKAKPGQLNYATTGAGGSGHLANEMLAMLAGIKTQHITYKGAAPAIVDVIGGQIQMFINNPLTFVSHIRSERLKAIAITGEVRIPALPQVPTFTESGLPGMDVRPWFFVVAPAGTPAPIVNKLSQEFTRIMALPDVMDYLAKQGMNAFSSTPEQLATLMKADMARWAKFIKAANIRGE